MNDQILTLKDVYNEITDKGAKFSDVKGFTHKIKTKGKNIRLSLGRIWFNLILPDDFELVDDIVDKKLLHNKIIAKIIDTHEPNEIAGILDKINKESTYMSTLVPQTIKITDIIVPDEIKKRKEEIVKKLNEDPESIVFDVEMKKLIKDYLDYLSETNSGLYNFIASGAKGDSNLFAALVLAKQNSVDIEGDVYNNITESQNEGYSLKTFFLNANEARFTAYFKSLGSRDPGAFARTAAYATNSVVINSDDCGSNRYLSYSINDKNKNNIIGRYYLDEKTKKIKKIATMDDAEKVVNKVVQLRSPIYCKDNDGICSVCYGELAKRNGSKFIGIVSSTVFNDLGINLAMKAKHKSDLGAASKSNFIKDIQILE